MANGIPAVRVDSSERFASLEERVGSLRSSVTGLEASTARGFAALDTKLAEISTSFARASQTPWSTIWTAVGVAFTILLGVGYLVYTPININQARVEASLEKLSDVVGEAIKTGPDLYIPRRESEVLRMRAIEDRVNITKNLDDLQKSKVGYPEWLQRQDTLNHEIADMQDRIAANTAAIATVNGGLPDVLRDMKARLERLEAEKLKP